MKALINLSSKINAIHSFYAMDLSFCIRKTNNILQKIDRPYLYTFGRTIADYLVKDKLKGIYFF